MCLLLACCFNALIATARLWLCFGGETTWQTAETKQNEISNNSKGKPRSANGGEFLQYEPPQIINQPLRNSAMHLVVSSSCTLARREARTRVLRISEVSGSNADPRAGCHNCVTC